MMLPHDLLNDLQESGCSYIKYPLTMVAFSGRLSYIIATTVH